MSEGLTRKKRIRGGHRGVVTKRSSEAEALMGRDSPDMKEVNRYVLILEKLGILRKLDSEILELIENEGEIVAEIERTDAHNQKVHDLLLRMKDYLKEPAVPFGGRGAVGVQPTSSANMVSRQARLPKLALPVFDGKLTSWFSFWELYDSAVHSNPDLSPVQKFSYLKTLLEGSAKEALSLTAESYTEAVDILKKRFGNKQKIIDKHMSILLSIEQVSSASNTIALRHLYDKLETNVRALKALGVSEDTYGTLLSSVLVSRLPSELQLMVGREIEGDWELKKIMGIVGRELEFREKTSTVCEDKPTGTEGRTDRRHTEKPSMATLLSGQGNNPEIRSSCCYCQRNHVSEECMKVVAVSERRRILRISGRCFVCTKKGHLGWDCRSRTRCRSCRGKHHSSIYPTSEVPTEGHELTQPTAQTPNQLSTHLLTQSTQVVSSGTPPVSHSLKIETVGRKPNRRTLLQTATVTLFNPDKPDAEQMNGMVIFDTGSQQSYITQQAAENLKLRRRGSKVLSIAAFGAEVGEPQRCYIVRVGLRKESMTNQNLTLMIVPFICGPVKGISKTELESDYPRLSQPELAECSLPISTSTAKNSCSIII